MDTIFFDNKKKLITSFMRQEVLLRNVPTNMQTSKMFPSFQRQVAKLVSWEIKQDGHKTFVSLCEEKLLLEQLTRLCGFSLQNGLNEFQQFSDIFFAEKTLYRASFGQDIP